MNTSTIPVQLITRLIRASTAAVIIVTLVSVIAQASEMTTDEVVTPAEQAVPERSDTVTIEIPIHKGLEYKLLMEKYAHLEYEWSTDGEALYFDFHGEPRGDTTGYFESFAITTSNNMKGSLTTPFAGSHGWYWKNETDAPVIVTLSIKGNYILKQ